MHKVGMFTLGAATMLLLTACGGGGPKPVTDPSKVGGETSPTTSSGGGADADRGAKLYAANCASCHGDKGEGTGGGPAVVGKAALPLDPPNKGKGRQVQFKTAADVLGYIKKAMPDDTPGSLKDDEYLDILAFDLKANGVDLGGKKLDATTAAQIDIH